MKTNRINNWVPNQNSLGTERTTPHRKLVTVNRPIGLESPWDASIWTFKKQRESHCININFLPQIEKHNQIDVQIHLYFAEIAKRYFAILDSNLFHDVSKLSFGSVVSRTRTLLHIISWMILNNKYNFKSLNFLDFENIKSEVSSGLLKSNQTSQEESDDNEKLSSDRIKECFTVFDDLYRMYNIPNEAGEYYLDDGLSYPMFDSFSDAISFAKHSGNPKGRTEDIDPEFVFPLFEAATLYIFKYADDILRLRDKFLNNGFDSNAAEVDQERRISANADFLLKKWNNDDPYLVKNNRISIEYISKETATNVNWYESVQAKEIIKRWEECHFGENISKKYITDTLAYYSYLIKNPTTLNISIKNLENNDKNIRLPFIGLIDKAHPWPIDKIGVSHWNPNSLESATNFLWTAIFIILAAFTSGRHEEILELTTDCLVEGPSGLEIRRPSFKGHNDYGVPIHTPAIKIVERAVKVAIRLSAASRAECGSNKLFFRNEGKNKGIPGQSTIRMRIEKFCDRVSDDFGCRSFDINVVQLRRLLPTVWIHYFGFGRHFPALQQALGHEDITTTMLYCTTMVPGERTTADVKKILVDSISRSTSGDLIIKGKFAKNISEMASYINISMLNEEEAMLHIEEHIEARNTQIFPLPWGYCVWWQGASFTAECRKNAVYADENWPTVRKNCEDCAGCANFLTSDVFSDSWRRIHASHQRIALNPKAPADLRKASQRGMKIAEHYM